MQVCAQLYIKKILTKYIKFLSFSVILSFKKSKYIFDYISLGYVFLKIISVLLNITQAKNNMTQTTNQTC